MGLKLRPLSRNGFYRTKGGLLYEKIVFRYSGDDGCGGPGRRRHGERAGENDSAFDADSFESLKRPGPGILIPEPVAPAPADKRGDPPRESSGQGSVPVHGYTLRQEIIMGAYNGSLRKRRA